MGLSVWAKAGSMAGVAARAATAKIVIEQMRGAIKSRLVRLAGVVLRAGSDVRLTRGIRRWKGDHPTHPPILYRQAGCSPTQLLFAGIPGLVIARRFWPPTCGKCRTRRPQGARRTGHVRPVRLLPGARLVVFLRGWRVDRMVQPTVPRRRHHRGFRVTVVDHPAALETERLVDRPAPGAIIAIAEFVLTDRFAIHPGPELGPECLRIPPGEQLEQEIFHLPPRLETIGTRGLLPPHRRIVQRGEGRKQTQKCGIRRRFVDDMKAHG